MYCVNVSVVPIVAEIKHVPISSFIKLYLSTVLNHYNSMEWVMRDMKKKAVTSDYFAGVLNLQDLISDDLRYTWCNNNRNKMHNKCNVLESSPNQPPTTICGQIVFHETSHWCQKCWGSLEGLSLKSLNFKERLNDSFLWWQKSGTNLPDKR